MTTREIIPCKQSLDVTLTLPGSKSITNRALLCAALAQGVSSISGGLFSDDTDVMQRALARLGVDVQTAGGVVTIQGVGGQFPPGDLEIDLHNAGTATRFLTAIMPLRSGETVITGDQRMQERPIADLVDGLQQIGADVVCLRDNGCPPVRIRSRSLTPTDGRFLVRMPGTRSSQYFSALLILGPLLGYPLEIEVIGDLVSKPYIDTTMAVMRAFGARVENRNYQRLTIQPGGYTAIPYRVEGDASAATYFLSLQRLHGGTVRFTNLDVDQSLQGDARYAVALGQLGQGRIDMNAMPDAAMTLAVTAVFAHGRTEIANVANLRIKETDRLAALEQELRQLNASVTATADGLTIDGAPEGPRRANPGSVRIHTYHDHRMAMCFSVLGTRIAGIVIEDPGCTDKTYPKFFDDLATVYLRPLNLGQKNLVLTGMRGCGKSYLGRKIADLLGRSFIDLDEEIVRDQCLSITDIVARHGWDYFRQVESEMCRPAHESPRSIFARHIGALVIATGGGVILREENMRGLLRDGVNVFIFADPHTLANRIRHDTDRPALTAGANIEDEIQSVWEQRRDLYLRYANVVWDNTDGQTVERSLTAIVAAPKTVDV